MPENMSSFIRHFLRLAIITMSVAANGAEMGHMPVPTFSNMHVGASITTKKHAGASYDDFIYNYKVGNPDSNTGWIAVIKINVLDSGDPNYHRTEGYNFSTGGGSQLGFMDWVRILESVGHLPPGKDLRSLARRYPAPGWAGWGATVRSPLLQATRASRSRQVNQNRV